MVNINDKTQSKHLKLREVHKDTRGTAALQWVIAVTREERTAQMEVSDGRRHLYTCVTSLELFVPLILKVTLSTLILQYY